MHRHILSHKRFAFSMLELIFVIVILGVVASIGSSVIVKTYESYIVQRALHRASILTELAATQLVNRLTFRIVGTTVAKNPLNPNTWLPVSAIGAAQDNTRTALEWIGYDNDSFSAQAAPGWSGYSDVITNASRAGFETPGSNLAITDTIINNLSNNTVNLTGGGQAPAIFFNASRSSDQYDSGNIITYGPGCMGLDYGTNNTSCVLAVSGTVNVGAADAFTFTTAPHTINTKTIYEHYKLAWSAYAVVPVPVVGAALISRGFEAGDTIFDLRLYYNYQPWLGEQYDDAGVTSSLLISNVSVFKFSESGGTTRFKLCTQQNIGGNQHATVCKEKAVIR